MVEALIAGAGPAGTAAAIALARCGVRVLLVDRARFPREKLCGDTINPGALAILAALGLDARVVAAGLPLEGMLVTSGSGVQVEGRYRAPLAGRALQRRDLDAALLAAAADAGVHVETGVRVTGALVDTSGPAPVVRGAVLERDGRRLRVPAVVTIAADGRRSTLAAAMGLASVPERPRRWAVGGYFSGVDALRARGEMHVRAGHYVGIAPVPGGLANACLVTSERRGLSAPEARLTSVLAADPLLGGRFASARLVSPVVCLGPLAVDVRAAGVRGLLLAGDAAGFVDPMTGDGVRLALHGGLLAAEAAWRHLEQPATDAVGWLANARRQAFGAKLRFDRILRAIVARPAGVWAGATMARLSPGLLRLVIARAGDTALAAGPRHDLSRGLSPTT